MATVSIQQIKNWFKKGACPTEQQFGDTFDSLRHRSEPIPIAEVDGLTEILNGKYNRAEGEAARQVVDDALTVAGETLEIAHTLEEGKWVRSETVKNIFVQTEAPDANLGEDGDICIVYNP